MEADKYQKLAMTTLNPEIEKKDVLVNAVMGLCAEAGEATDLVKKHLFQGHELKKEELVKELGDVAWYLAEAATALDVDLSVILEKNIEKLKQRFPKGFDAERSMYRYFGSEDRGLCIENPDYPAIHTPQDLYDTLSGIWCEETCAPRMRKDWSEKNRTLGQCAITAFLAQDIFGGEVYGVPLEDGNFHCFNVVDGHTFDLTSEQFEKSLDYSYVVKQAREDHFAKEEKYQRYLLLKERLEKTK